MATPFVSEIRMFGFNFAPRGWADCSGQLMSIAQNSALFSLVGTFYGGNGQTNFALPDLRGRTPVHAGDGPGLSSRTLGQVYGSESVTLTPQEMPVHSHVPMASSANATTSSPGANTWAVQPSGYYPYQASPGTPMQAGELAINGSNAAHENRQPLLALMFCIALTGVFPSRN